VWLEGLGQLKNSVTSSGIVVSQCFGELVSSTFSSASYLFYGGFLIGLVFDPEDGDMFSKMIVIPIECLVLYHRIWNPP
jgi:hypothetical protein